jgi:hypothetical protein
LLCEKTPARSFLGLQLGLGEEMVRRTGQKAHKARASHIARRFLKIIRQSLPPARGPGIKARLELPLEECRLPLLSLSNGRQP